jgi:endonuclease/exonuclease/phosphatase family metal-dependent hydrolase
MPTFRIMSYHINGCRTAAGELAPELCARVIRSQRPDLVMLQQIGAPQGLGALELLSGNTALCAYGPEEEGSCAYLSRFPLHNLQEFHLGHGGLCLRADLDLGGERIHLFNLCLSFDPWQRRDQILELLGEQLLNNPSLPCAAIVCGDFTLPLWGCGQIRLSEHLRRASLPLWRANYPSNFPLWGRDRIYFRGALRALAGTVVGTADARKASPHLPLVLTVESSETRRFLKLKEASPLGKQQPDPVCG